MAYKKLKNGKIRVYGDHTIDGIRYRPSCTVKTNLTGLQLKAFVKSKEIELLEDVKLQASDADKLSRLDIQGACKWYLRIKDLEQNTIDSYNKYINNKRVIGFFKTKKVIAITSADAKRFFKKLDKEISAQTKKPLSQKTKKNYLTYLHAIFQELKEKRIIEENPFSDITVRVPKKLNSNKFYGIEEVKHHINVLSNKAPIKYFLFYVLTVMCGLRPAEARGLKWNKIDWIEKKIYIDQSLAATQVGYITKSTKNEEPRVLDLIDLAIKLLQIHYSDELEKYKENKITKPISENYIFTNANGDHIGESTFRNWWYNFCERNNLRYVCPYGLRHTTATMLAFNNIPLANIAQQMGHLDTSTTLVYIHAVEEGKKEINNVLNENINVDFLKVQ